MNCPNLPTLTLLWTVQTYPYLHYYELSELTHTYISMNCPNLPKLTFLWTVQTYQHLHFYELSWLTNTYISMNCPNLPTLTLLWTVLTYQHLHYYTYRFKKANTFMKTLQHIFKTGNSLVKEIRCTMLHCDLMWANFTRDNLDEQT